MHHALLVAGVAPNTFAYRLVFLLHLTCVIVGFGSTFVYPILGSEARRRRGVEAKALSEASLLSSRRITTPVIYAAIFFGVLLVGIGDPLWKFSQAWVSIALVLAIAAVVFSGFVHMPNLKKMDALTSELVAMGPPPEGTAPSGPPPQVAELERRGKEAARNGGILHLVFLLLVIDMIWKPFL